MDRWDDIAVKREERRLRAVIADDDAGIRRLLTAVLELEGWDVRCAADGAEAVALAESYQPDAVLLDIMMPNLDGLAALRQIRAGDGNRDVPVLWVSALGGAEVAEAEAAGADDYMVKPLPVEDVPKRVLRLLQRDPVDDPAA